MLKKVERPIHPLADIFPMMDDDELQNLAADIKENGLLNPILVADINGTETIIDGRNRLSACQIAGVDPEFEAFDGNIPALIISADLQRRNLTKGQQAMAVAMIYPEAEKGGRGNKGKAPETGGFSRQ